MIHAHVPKSTPGFAYDGRQSEPVHPVNKPAHYQRGGIETIDYIRASLGEGFTDYCIGNALKYLSRFRDKDGLQDLSKAQVYLGWAIESVKKDSPQQRALDEMTRCAQEMGLYDDTYNPLIKNSHPMMAETLREDSHE